MMLVRAADDWRERDGMLAKHLVDVMLTATDLGAVKQFHGDRIGLEDLIGSDELVTLECGGDSRSVVTRTGSPSSEEHTRALS
jgi:hypothetical protein